MGHEIGERDQEVQTSSCKISLGDVMYSMRNMVNSIILTLYGFSNWISSGDHFAVYAMSNHSEFCPRYYFSTIKFVLSQWRVLADSTLTK